MAKTLKYFLLGEDKTASKSLRNQGQQADKTHAKLGKLGGSAGRGLAGAAAIGAAAVAAAAAAVGKFGIDSLKAYQGAAKSQRELEDAYKRFPSVQDVSIESLRKYNEALQRKTGADADDMASGQAVLARYKLTGKQLKEVTPLLDDYAKRTGKSLPDAATTLGKALAGNGRAMKELGIKFKDAGSPAKNYGQIVDGLRDKVGGFATKEAGTLDGKLARMKVGFEDVQEAVGAKLAPAFEQFADLGLEALGWLDDNPEVIDGVVAGFELLGDAIIGMVKLSAPGLALLVRGFAWVAEGMAKLLDGLGDIPGFGWAKDAAAKLRTVSEGAKKVADGLDKIPDKLTVNFSNPGAKVTEAQAKAVLNAVKAIPSAKSVKILSPGARPSKADVDRLMRSVKGIPKEKRAAIKTIAQLGGIAAAKKALSSVRSKTVHVTTIHRVRQASSNSTRAVAHGMVYYADGTENHVAEIAPAGAWRIWAKPEPGGEAYIPLPAPRPRRTLRFGEETARRLGAIANADGAIYGGRLGASTTVYLDVRVPLGADRHAAAREIARALTSLKTAQGGRALTFQT